MDPENYDNIGELLRSARVERRLSIDQASRQLHIRVRYLEALEEGNLSDLPGLAYTRGYLQSYAAFLGLDKDEILRRFEEMEAVLARKNFYFPQVFSKEKTPSLWAVWGSLMLAVIVYGVWMIFSHSAPPAVSQVEELASSKPHVRVSIATLRDVACLRPPEGLYPPCTLAKSPVFSLLPVLGLTNSIMELAHPESH